MKTPPERLPVRSEYRSLLIADIEGYTARTRTDAVRSRLRSALRNLIGEALCATDIEPARYTSQTTGDGLLITIDPAIGKPRILRGVIDALSIGLCRQNHLSSPAQRLRIRVVMHAGDVLIDLDGPLGAEVNRAFRLLDAEELRVLLRHAAGPMVVCVSDLIYRQVILQHHEGLDPREFELIRLRLKGTSEFGWVRAPGEPGLVARTRRSAPPPLGQPTGLAFPEEDDSVPA